MGDGRLSFRICDALDPVRDRGLPRNMGRRGPNSYKNLHADSCVRSSWGEMPRNNKKFMQTLETETYRTIAKEALQRGATVQELLRAVIIPEWLTENRKKWGK